MKVVVPVSLAALALLTASCSQTQAEPGASPSAASPTPDLSAGVSQLGELGSETFPGLTINLSQPRKVKLDPDNSTAPKASDRVTFVVRQTYVNTRPEIIKLGAAGTKAMSGAGQSPCQQVFAQKPLLGATAKDPVLPYSQRSFLVGFSCQGQKGDPLTMMPWAQEESGGDPAKIRNVSEVIYVGELP